MKAKVTIGLCVKNSDSTIKETLDSIFDQDFPCNLMELIVVDDGSEDRTLEIVKSKLEGAGIRSRIFCENKGLGNARQTVVDNASGEYIIWVDGDMTISKSYIKKTVEFMEQNPKVGIAKGIRSIKCDRNILATLVILSTYAETSINYQSENAYSKTLGTGGSIYRSEAIKQVGGFDRDLRYYCEDWDAEIKITSSGWLRAITNVEFGDHERIRLAQKDLWRKYWLRGYYTHYFLHKRPGLVKHYRMFPPAAFLAGLLNALKVLKLTQKKEFSLLPFFYVFKSVAFYVGFIHSHLNSYEPKAS